MSVIVTFEISRKIDSHERQKLLLWFAKVLLSLCKLPHIVRLGCQYGILGCLAKCRVLQLLLNFFRIYGSMQLQATALLSVMYKSICQRLGLFKWDQKSQNCSTSSDRAGAELIPAVKFSRMPCGAVRCLCRWGQGHASNRRVH